jgi:hypothetical protein
VNNTSSKFLLDQVQSGLYSQKELKQLIDITYNISVAFLKNSFKSKINYSLYSHDSIKDLALDTILPLFIKNNSGILGIKRALDNWTDPILDDNDADFFISKLIWKRADQTITNLLKERDPIFDKILKTLNLCISNNKIKKIRYFGTVYIVDEKITSLDGNLIKSEAFDKLPSILFSYKQITLFEKLFDYLKRNTEYIPAIPLNLLIKKIKEFHIGKNYYMLPSEENVDNTFIYKDIIESGLNTIKERIETFYIPNSRLNKEDAEIIMASFSDMTNDILCSGFTGSLYDYLKFRNNSITTEQFYKNYHSIMNNLLKNFRNRISELVD